MFLFFFVHISFGFVIPFLFSFVCSLLRIRLLFVEMALHRQRDTHTHVVVSEVMIRLLLSSACAYINSFNPKMGKSIVAVHVRRTSTTKYSFVCVFFYVQFHKWFICLQNCNNSPRAAVRMLPPRMPTPLMPIVLSQPIEFRFHSFSLRMKFYDICHCDVEIYPVYTIVPTSHAYASHSHPNSRMPTTHTMK